MSSENEDDGNGIVPVVERLPAIIGNLTIQVCLANYPLALMGVNLFSGLGSTFIQIKAEKKTKFLLSALSERITKLESDGKIFRESLRLNEAYQEVAHARLLKISTLDSEAALRMSANLITMSALIDGNGRWDKYILRAISDILTEELQVMILLGDIQSEYVDRVNSFSDLERRDNTSYENANAVLLNKFKEEGRKKVEAHDIDHLVLRLRSSGLMDPGSASSHQHQFSLRLSSLGRNFLDLYRSIGS